MKPQKTARTKGIIIIGFAFVVLREASVFGQIPVDGKMGGLDEAVAGNVPAYDEQVTNGTLVRRSGVAVLQKNTIRVAGMPNPYLAGTRTIRLFCKIDASGAIATNVEQWSRAVCKAMSVRLEQGLKIPVEIASGASSPAGGDQGTFGVLNIEVNGVLNDGQISARAKWATSIIKRGVDPEVEGNIVTQVISGDILSESNYFAGKLVDTLPFFY